MGKTIVAVRPGFLSQAQAHFGDMEIEVDPTLGQDYEFRQRDLGLADLLEAELEGEERESARKADPKNAHTLVVPLLRADENDLSELELATLTYAVIRLDRKDDKYEARRLIAAEKPILNDEDVNVKATIVALHNLLKKAGFTVYSISPAEMLVMDL